MRALHLLGVLGCGLVIGMLLAGWCLAPPAIAQAPALMTMRCVSDGTTILSYTGDLRRGRFQILIPPHASYRFAFTGDCDFTWSGADDPQPEDERGREPSR